VARKARVSGRRNRGSGATEAAVILRGAREKTRLCVWVTLLPNRRDGVSELSQSDSGKGIAGSKK
jgi:hypothetical protein